tara:strand:+ start:364 stop:540 length:177 start_codon:yes stop_codon:yes gene_type:complete
MLKVKLKMKKLLVDAGHRNYWENEKLVNGMLTKEFKEFFFSDRINYVYSSMKELGCFK